jgi:amino acid adenylation domain-containing protein/non-ribosomal peptide synthase protein (TIGR01720 family)
LFDQLLYPDVPLYNVGGYLRIDGPIEQAVFEQALNQVIKDNDALRIILHKGETLPVLEIVENVIIHLDYHDFSEPENTSVALAWMKQAFIKPFQLYNNYLFQFALLKTSDECYYWFNKYHHLIVDGWTRALIARRVASAYNAILAGPANDDSRRYSYLDFIQANQTYLKSEKFIQHKRYWLEKYQHLPEPLIPHRLATQVNGKMIPSQGSTALSLARTKYQQIVQFAKQNHVSMFHVLIGVLYCYFMRVSGAENFVIGLPLLNRNNAAFKQTAGVFVTVSPVKFDFGLTLNFVQLVQAIRWQLQQDYRYQRCPLSEINRQLKIHTQNRLQLFDLQLSYMDHDYDIHFAGNRVEMVRLSHGFETNALSIYINDYHKQHDVLIDFEYNWNAFDETEMDLFKDRFEFILTEILQKPSVLLVELQLMPFDELRKILVEFNDTATSTSSVTNYSRDKTIVDLFEQQVEKTPDNIAVVFENQSVTYRDLNSQANQLAHYLQTLGVKPEVQVGICVERSVEMVIGLLGILKAGGAYLPLDPALPKARLAFMLEDAQVSVLLTQSSLIKELPNTIAPVVSLDTQTKRLSQMSERNPSSRVEPANLAYVIYTSGSTGSSKGVMITHRSLVNIYQAWENAYQLNTLATSHLQMANFSFDVFTGDLVRALCSGAKLVLCPREWLLIPEKLYQLMRNEQVDCAEFVPVVLRNLLQYLERSVQNINFMKLLIVGSDSWYMQEYQEVRQICNPSTRIINSYGVSEATIDSTYFESTQVNLPADSLVPIGHPFANTQVYILDSHQKPVSLCVPGELYIGGAGIARGYLNRPDLMANKFIKNPLSSDPNSRLYQTGDLARYLPDGNIEYMGRIDNQVKIRGFRIELGEIEAVLAQHPFVTENAVIVHEASKTDKRLVAYIVVALGQVIENTALRSFLTERLPDYMVPSIFVTKENLPLTPNGKIDRRTLVWWVERSKTDQLQLSKEHFVAPQTHEEKLLAGIWAEVLGIKQVGVHDNFFELGGDSIISFQVIFRASQAGLQLTPRQFFQHQTIAELARVAKTALSRNAEQGLVTGKVPLIPIQHWFFEQEMPDVHHFNQAFLFKVSPTLQPEQLEPIVKQLMQHHDALRLRFSEEQKQLNSSNCSLNPYNGSLITVKDYSYLTEEEQRTLIESMVAELQASLNLEDGPLLRLAWFRLGFDGPPNRLFWVIHHLAVDGVSWRILLEDFITAYQQLTQRETIVLPPKTTSFQQWAKRLTEYAISDTLNAELDYWLTNARGQVKPLPVDYPLELAANTVADAAQVTVFLSLEQTRALLNEVPKAYRTQINDVLLTALVQSFAGWTGEKSLLIDLEGHGREELFEDIDLSRTVGWFTSIFPVLLDLRTTANDTGAALIAIKEQLHCIPHHGIGYGLLRYLNKKAASQLQALPQAQVSFNYFGQFHQFSKEPLLGLAQEKSGVLHSAAANPRSYLLDIYGIRSEGELHFSWKYNENYHRRSTIERLAQNFITVLQALIVYCQSPEVSDYTPSDFP